jgi:hypothetical protein
MSNSGPVPLAPVQRKLALSWADMLVIVFLLAAGIEVGRCARRLAEVFVGRPDSESTRDAAIAEREQRLQWQEDELASLQSALVEGRVDAARERENLAAIAAAHPGVAGPSPDARPTAPDEVKAAYALAQNRAAVAERVVSAITSDRDRLRSEAIQNAAALRSVRHDRDAALTAAQQTLARRTTAATVVFSLVGTLALLATVWLLLPASAVNAPIVFAIAGAGLLILVLQLAVGSLGALAAILLLTVLLRIRSGWVAAPTTAADASP